MIRPAENRLPPPPRDNAGRVAVFVIAVLMALLSLAVLVVTA
jgi:hypothetical protein